MQFVDTNIFIRHLTKDDLKKSEACFALFQKAQKRQIKLTTSETIIAEVVFVLSSKKLYNLNRVLIRTLLYPIIGIRGLTLKNKRIILRSLDIYALHSVDFEDALSVAHMEQQAIKTIISYDTDFDQFPQIQRTAP